MSSDENVEYFEKKRKHKESSRRNEDKNDDKERRRRRHKKDRSENKIKENEIIKETYEDEIVKDKSHGKQDDQVDKGHHPNDTAGNNNNKDIVNEDDQDSDDQDVKIMKPSRHLDRSSVHEDKISKQRVKINLWDLAVEQMEVKDKHKKSAKNNKCVIFLGGKAAGKTTVLLKCLGRTDDNIRATVGIDYTFTTNNKNKQDEGEELGDVWELGGGVMLGRLVENLVSLQNIRDTSVVMVVDLSDPCSLWVVVETWVELLKSRVNAVIKKQESSHILKEELEKKVRSLYVEDHPDLKLLDLQLLPILIVANKYDVLQNMEGEDRRVICKTLRFLAHRIGAHLQFCSAGRMDVSKAKSFVNHCLFHTPLAIPMQTAHNKALSIVPGQDSFQDIGMPTLPDGDTGRLSAKTPLELWKYAFNKRFPQKDIGKLADAEDPTLDPQFREAQIDAIKRNKDQELLNYMKSQNGNKLFDFN